MLEARRQELSQSLTNHNVRMQSRLQLQQVLKIQEVSNVISKPLFTIKFQLFDSRVSILCWNAFRSFRIVLACVELACSFRVPYGCTRDIKFIIKAALHEVHELTRKNDS
jgi:hypothetical protein